MKLILNEKLKKIEIIHEMHYSKSLNLNKCSGLLGYMDTFDRAMGMLTPYSHVPISLLPNSDEMTYSQRVYNLILTIYQSYVINWIALPQQEVIAQKYFGHLASEFTRYHFI